MMDLNVLLQTLGYLGSERHWVTLEAADSRLAHHYRLAQRAGEEAGEGGHDKARASCISQVENMTFSFFRYDHGLLLSSCFHFSHIL